MIDRLLFSRFLACLFQGAVFTVTAQHERLERPVTDVNAAILFNDCRGAGHHGKLLIATFGTHLPPWQHMYLGSTFIEESMLMAVHSERNLVSIVEGFALRLATSGSCWRAIILFSVRSWRIHWRGINKALSMLCSSSILSDGYVHVLRTVYCYTKNLTHPGV